MIQSMLDWLRAWARRQFGDSRRAAGSTEHAARLGEEELDKVDRECLYIALGDVIQYGMREEEESEPARCGGQRLRAANKRAAEQLCRPQSASLGADPLADIGEEVQDLIAEGMQGGQAPGTARAYTLHWSR
jgi:hypothetical protein